MKIISNTLVKNGEPFTYLVLNQAVPFVEKMLITISAKADKGTKEAIDRLKEEHPDKVEVRREHVNSPGELTIERQKQLDKVPDNYWVWFLDIDDAWPVHEIQRVLMFLSADVDALAVNPYQIVSEKTYDHSWRYKWFTKFFKKQKGVHYEGDWPRDLIYKGEEVLYWRKNLRVPQIQPRYYHLSNLMNWRFRDEAWAKEYQSIVASEIELPQAIREEELFKKIIKIWKK